MSITPKEFAFADGELAEAMNLPPRDGGWGLLLCVDERDLRYTYAGDPEYLRLMLDISPDAKPGTVPPIDLAKTAVGGLEMPAETMPLRKRGWPDSWKRKEQRAEWERLRESSAD